MTEYQVLNLMQVSFIQNSMYFVGMVLMTWLAFRMCNNVRNNPNVNLEGKLFTSENKLLFEEIINQTNNFENYDFENLNVDMNLIDRVYKYASIKHILVKNLNDDQKILEILSELIRDLKNYELELRITDLESRFSKDLSEATFNELKELKKLQKIN